MTAAPPPLFDVDALRVVARPTLGVLRRPRPLVVLGSTQSVEDLDHAALDRDGVEVRRRRGGGGAVLLREADCWIELWRPAEADTTSMDVRETAYEVGGWWRVALAALGVVAEVHEGGFVSADQGSIACFAGLGPGELTVAGAKLVGISQWRSREGVLVSSVLSSLDPSDLSAYLSPALLVPRLREATSMRQVLVGIEARTVAASFEAVVTDALPELVPSPTAFE